MSFFNEFFDFLMYKEKNFKERYLVKRIKKILSKIDDLSERQDNILKELDRMNWELIRVRNLQVDIKEAFRAIRLDID